VPDLDGLPVSEQEIQLLRDLTNAGVPFMLVGLGAAVVQGADAVTKDLDLWFPSISHPGLAEAAQRLGRLSSGETIRHFFRDRASTISMSSSRLTVSSTSIRSTAVRLM